MSTLKTINELKNTPLYNLSKEELIELVKDYASMQASMDYENWKLKQEIKRFKEMV